MTTALLSQTRFVTDCVVVQQGSPGSGAQRVGALRWRHGRTGRLEIGHDLDLATVSDARMVAELDGLVQRGVLEGRQQFEDAATGVILTCADDAGDCWRAFYANSLRELSAGRSPFAPIHRRALSLISGSSLLEVGCCFGFFALQAAAGHCADVYACDISAGAVRLLDEAARQRTSNVQVVCGDALALPYPDDFVDTVTLIHLLEHLPGGADLAIAEALRVARRRVVIAVPHEQVASAHFGHHHTLTPLTLARWAETAGQPDALTFSDHGGWLVLSADHNGR